MQTRQHRGRHDKGRGAAAVEFALVLPLLMMLVFGAVQFGTLFNRQQALHAAAREGARVGALSSSTLTDIQTHTNDALNGVSMEGTPTIAVTPNVTKPCEGRTGETVIVLVTVATTIEIPVWGTETKNIKGRGEFRCE